MTTRHIRPEKMAQGHADSLALSPRHTGVHNRMADLQPMLASFTPPSPPVCTMHQQHQYPPQRTEMSLESPPQTYCIRICILIRSICTFVSTSSLAHVAYEEHWLTLTHVPDLGAQNLGAQHSWEPVTPSRKTGLAQWRPDLHGYSWWDSHLQTTSLDSPHLRTTAPAAQHICTALDLRG